MWYPNQSSRCFASSNKHINGNRPVASGLAGPIAAVWLAMAVFSGSALAQSGPRSIVPDRSPAGLDSNAPSGPGVAPDRQISRQPGTRVMPGMQPPGRLGSRITPGMQPPIQPGASGTAGAAGVRVTPGMQPPGQLNSGQLPDLPPGPVAPSIATDATQPAPSGTGPSAPDGLSAPGGLGAPGSGVLGTLPASLVDDAPAGSSVGVIPPAALVPADSEALIALFNKIKGPMPSPELQVFTQGYLLDKGFQELGAQVGLARGEALYRLGFVEDAAGAVVAQESTSVAQRAATARMLLALGQQRIACERANVSGFPKGASEGPTFELLRILGYCKLVEGNTKAARLIAGLLREQGGADRLYRELMEAKPSERQVRRAKIKRLRPVHVALLAKAGIPIPARFVPLADPALLARLARNSQLVETRVAAAERAVSLGLLGISDLEKLYSEIDLNGADPARLIKQSARKKPSSSRVVGRAQMLGLMIDGTDRDRVSLARAAFAEARRAGITRAVVEFIGEELAGIESPQGFGARDIGSVIEILTMADRPEAAFSWLDAGELGDATTGKSTLGPAGIYRGRALIMMLAPNMGLEFGVDVGAVKFSKRDRAFIRTQTALLGALGDEVPPAVAQIAGRVPDVPDLGDLSRPVAMLGLLAPFSGRSYAKIPLAQLVRGLGALRALGLDTDARRVAVDALLARS